MARVDQFEDVLLGAVFRPSGEQVCGVHVLSVGVGEGEQNLFGLIYGNSKLSRQPLV